MFVAQRASAVVLVPLVIIHLGLILLAVRGGLSAGEILARTRGSIWWALFYGTFVIAAAIHAPIGVRNILNEWTGANRTYVNGSMMLLGLLFLGLGFRAVLAVV